MVTPLFVLFFLLSSWSLLPPRLCVSARERFALLGEKRQLPFSFARLEEFAGIGDHAGYGRGSHGRR